MKKIIKLLLGFNTISLIHLLRLTPKMFLYACKDAFNASRNPSLPEVKEIPKIHFEEILSGRQPIIRLSVIPYEDGSPPLHHTSVVLALLVLEAPIEVLEIGTYMGHSTLQMALSLETATIHTVDLPEHFSVENDSEKNILKDDLHLINRRIVGIKFKGHPCANRIIQHFADTASWDFREAGHPTFFFIDGSHTYEYCKNDSEKCFELCGGRGVFLWHDCDIAHPGVVRLICEWRAQGRDIKLISGTPIAYWKSS